MTLFDSANPAIISFVRLSAHPVRTGQAQRGFPPR